MQSPWFSDFCFDMQPDYHPSQENELLIVHFFHAQLGSDVFPNMRLLHISLNTIYTLSECKPSSLAHPYHPLHILSKSSCPYPHISPLPPPHFYRLTLNHLHSYVPHAQTTSIYHASPPQPRSEPQKTVQIHTAFPILQRHPAHPSHHHPFRPLHTLQICFLHRPGFSPICQYTLDASLVYLSLYVV